VTTEYSVFERIDKWVSLGFLNHLDRAFVRFLRDLAPDTSDLVLWAGALVSHQLGQGEVYLDIEKLCQHPETTLAIQDSTWQSENQDSLVQWTELNTYKLENWIKKLKQSSLVQVGIKFGQGSTPMVLDGNHLYLRRFWQYQQTLTSAIQQRLQPIRETLPEALQQQIAQLFPSKSAGQPDWQKIACVLALRARFTIITGGPGTGKTTTLSKLLVLLITMANSESNKTQKFNILLAAPTGKAAARVSESIGNALKNLNIADDIQQYIPKKASTLHRLLGSRSNSRLYKHNRNNPLVADIVIIDEASMVDLEMLAALVDALPEFAQLILLGDKDQLSSVEAGSVMGDLCHGSENSAYDKQTRAWIKRYSSDALSEMGILGSAINQQTVMLRYSHRFGEHSGIGQLAKAVNTSDVVSAQAILNDAANYRDINRLRLHNPTDEKLRQLVLANSNKPHEKNALIRPGYGSYFDIIRQHRPTQAIHYDQWAKLVLAAFDSFRVLCALRQGLWGVESLNQHIEDWLFPTQKPALWYEGRPVMITRNDYSLGLMNGDIGMTLFDSSGKLRVAFVSNNTQDETKILWISPMRLADVETAFAMTVHKSQGSEFDHVALILPETKSPAVTRELIYTGITRAKECFTLLESRAEVFNEGVLTSRK
jgi:exodeoxyribonuclease V alpha subunit